MISMLRRGMPWLALSWLAFLSACVSTSTLPSTPSSNQEAALYNMDLGISYLRQGDLKTARDKLEKAISQDSGLAIAYSALGLVYERMNDMPLAEKNYRKSLSIAPRDPDVLNAMAAFLCLRRGEPVEALRHFDRALAVPESRSESNRAMLLTNAGVCAKQIDLERAESHLRDALAVDPGYADALLQLADVSQRQDRGLQARAFLERYLAAAPPSAAALWLGYQIEQSLGKTAAAADYAERIRRDFPTSREAGQLLGSERHGG